MSLSRDCPSSRFLARYGLALVGLLFVPRSQLHDMLSSERRAPEWQLVKDWPRLPTDVQLGQVSGVSIDTAGHVLLFRRADRTFDRTATVPIGAPTVLELDPLTGTVLKSWGEGLFLIPHSLTVDRHNNVWLTDVGRHQVFKFSHDGVLLLTVGERRVPGWDSTHFNEPTDVAVSADGSFYVSDGYTNSRIAHFSPTGRLLSEWGTKGDQPGQFQIPHGVALDARGRVYVADRENLRLQIFDTTGTVLRVWPRTPTAGRAYAVAVTPSGYVYLARKDGPEAITIVDGEGREVGMIPTDTSVVGTPHAIAVQGDTVIYVADTFRRQIHKFVRR